ncbi:alpha/beta fold hydrolase [Amycolatopsis sp. H20-H5]|uniref:alpha/beta fold hydrolase n=1 Tax=Amycolatopsis sp. H20-H5 TaxID=3046309 RepID=UPI002DB6A505|nr:alpha/beta hydrolase [Amycolatopsis sp. H20-H5]MEC3977840.1 alpha/beta hydrolase [Amycolatopsis sp. H20-H5]
MSAGAAAGGLAAAGITPAAADTTGVPSDAELARSLPGGFTSNFVVANGIRQHYVIGGQGEPLVLLHGWPQNWWEFHKVLPALAARYRVIAVDLRGGGSTDKPQSGYDKKTMANDIFELIGKLGYGQVNIAGHDIGSMVAFSFAVNHAAAVKKVAILDVTHPDDSYFQIRALPQPGSFSPWWFAFNQVRTLPEQLLAGRGRFLIDWVFDNLPVNPAAFSDFDRAVYARAFSQPDGIRGGNGWYQAFAQDIADLKTYGKVTAPMLGLAHIKFYAQMQAVLPTQGTDVQVALVEKTGHYFLEEQPEVVTKALLDFFG